MKQHHHQKIKRYKNSFNGKAAKGLLIRRIVTFVVLLLILFGAGWLLAKPGIDLGTKLWYQLKNGISGDASSSVSAPSQPPSDTGSSSSSSSSSPQEQPSAPVPVSTTKGNWAYVALSSVNTDQAATATARALKQDGVCAAVLELKDERGFVYYNSSVPLAQGSLSADLIDARAAAALLVQNGITPIASISAFKDASAPRLDKDIAVTYNDQKEFLWLNNKAEQGGVPWLNPYADGAVQYITDLLKEVLDAGFKEVIITGANFPTGYSLDLAGYGVGDDTRTKDAVLRDCVAKWQAMCEEKDAVCWFEYSAVSALSESDTSTIQSPFTFNANHLLLDFAASVITEKEGTTLDYALFDAAVSMASPDSILAMRVSGAKLSGDALLQAATKAQAAGFYSVVPK